MLDALDRFMMAGIGAMSMTKERADELFDEYVNRGKAERENKSGFVKEVLDQAEKSRSEFEKLIDKQVRETVEKLGLATKEDVKRIEEKLDMLLAKQE